MIRVTELNTGKETIINEDYILEIVGVEHPDSPGELYSRVYMATGHRTFIETSQSPMDILAKIGFEEDRKYEKLAKKIGSQMKNRKIKVKEVFQ